MYPDDDPDQSRSLTGSNLTHLLISFREDPTSSIYNILLTTSRQRDKQTVIKIFIWVFTSLSTLYRPYHDGWLEGKRKPVHTVGQASVL